MKSVLCRMLTATNNYIVVRPPVALVLDVIHMRRLKWSGKE